MCVCVCVCVCVCGGVIARCYLLMRSVGKTVLEVVCTSGERTHLHTAAHITATHRCDFRALMRLEIGRGYD